MTPFDVPSHRHREDLKVDGYILDYGCITGFNLTFKSSQPDLVKLKTETKQILTIAKYMWKRNGAIDQEEIKLFEFSPHLFPPLLNAL